MPDEQLPRGIQEMRPGYYRVRLSVNGVQHTIGLYDNPEDAKNALTAAKAQKALGTFVPPKLLKDAQKAARAEKAKADAAAKYTMTDLARDWLDWLEKQGRAESTIYTYQSRMDVHIKPTFGNLVVTAVTPRMVEDWYDKLDTEHGNGIARNAYMTLASMFTYAMGKAKGQRSTFEPLVSESPCRITGAAQHKPVKVRSRKVFTPDEVSEIAAEMPDDSQLAVLLAAWCGLRIGEVLALRRRDIERTERDGTKRTWIRIERQVQAKGAGLYETTPKSAAGIRVVPVPPALIPALNDHLLKHAGKGVDGLIFHRGDGTWLHPNVMRTRFNVARDKVVAVRQEAELPAPEGLVFHDLRRTSLTRAGQAGATLAELQLYGGHADAKTVQIYQTADLDRLARLADVMDNEVKVPTLATVTELRAKS